ncbi:MAG: hypothetical protein R3E12_09260 [Candidatus Eisenbacteria bacterium]
MANFERGQVGLGVGGSGIIEHCNLGSNDYPRTWRDWYFTGFVDQDLVPVATSDLSGTLKLTRSGTTLTGYYLSLGSWVAISSAVVTTADMSMHISAWSHDRFFTDQEVKVAFDNFTVNQGELVCPVASVSGVVLTDCFQGTPLPDAVVTVRQDGVTITQGTTGDDGSYYLQSKMFQ